MSDDQKIEYLCQRCQQALRLDPSLINIDEHTLAELALPISPAPDLRILAQVRSDPELKVWKFKAEKSFSNYSDQNLSRILIDFSVFLHEQIYL